MPARPQLPINQLIKSVNYTIALLKICDYNAILHDSVTDFRLWADIRMLTKNECRKKEQVMQNQSPIIMGSDRAAYPLKEKIKQFLIEQGIDIEDAGTHGETSVDYPDYGIKVASAVSKNEFQRGILLCGTGLGMSMVANRFPHVRAALCSDVFSARMSRAHNDANILVMGGRVIGEELAMELVRTWLDTPFDGGRHQGRLDKFDTIS